MAESSDRALSPDETANLTAEAAEALCRFAPLRPEIAPFEEP